MNQDLISALTEFLAKEVYRSWDTWGLVLIGAFGLAGLFSGAVNAIVSESLPKWGVRRKIASITAGGLVGVGMVAYTLHYQAQLARTEATYIAAVAVSKQLADFDMACTSTDKPCLHPDMLKISLLQRQSAQRVLGRTVEGKVMPFRAIRIPLDKVSKIDSIIAASGSRYTLAQK